MATLQEIYDMALELLDRRDFDGNLDQNRLRSLERKAPAMASVLCRELCALEGGAVIEARLSTLADRLPTGDFASYGALPYGLAGQLAAQGGDEALAALFLSEYEKQKRRIKRAPGVIRELSEDIAMRLAGRC